MPDELSYALAVACEAATQAGALIRNDFHLPGGPRGHGDHAEVDTEAEHLIRARLRQAFPDWGYRGEETGSVGVENGPRYLWLVDPNDGTRNYLQGFRGSAVSIALLRDQQPVLGVVYAPCAPDDDGDFIAWADGCGPVRRNGRPLDNCSWPDTLEAEHCILVSQDMDTDPSLNAIVVAPGRYRAIPSIAYRLATTAAGDAVIGTSLKGAGDWDYAAGHALLRARGGELFHKDGSRITYTPQGVSRSRGCYGGGPALVPSLLDRQWGSIARDSWRFYAHGYPAYRATLKLGRNIADAPLLRRAQGALFGHLAGGALSSLRPTVRSTGLGLAGPLLAGQPCGSSEMALALARSLVANVGYSADAAASVYSSWYRSAPADCDQTTAQALQAIMDTPLGPTSLRTVRGSAAAISGAANRDSQSNESLARLVPIGIWGHALPSEEVAETARQESQLTHPNLICQEACAAYAVALAYAIDSGAVASEVYQHTLTWARSRSRSPEVVDALDAVNRPSQRPGADSDHVLATLDRCFRALLGATDFFEAASSHGNGSGSAASAAALGALFGAVHGREAVPADWRNLILSCRPANGAPGVERPRPEIFWPVDTLELAELLLLQRR